MMISMALFSVFAGRLSSNDTRLDVQIALREWNLDAVFLELVVDALVEAVTQDDNKCRQRGRLFAERAAS